MDVTTEKEQLDIVIGDIRDAGAAIDSGWASALSHYAQSLRNSLGG